MPRNSPFVEKLIATGSADRSQERIHIDLGEDTDRVPITFRVPSNILDKMRTLAKANRRSLNAEIVAALEEYQ